MVVVCLCGITARLCYDGFITLWELFNNPLGNVFCRWVEVEQLIKTAMVKIAMNSFLDVSEVNNHAFSVEFC